MDDLLTGWLATGGWLAGHRDPRIQSTRPVEGNEPIPGAHTCIQIAACRIQDTGYWIQDTGYRIQDTGDMKGCKDARIQDTKATCNMLKEYASQPGGP